MHNNASVHTARIVKVLLEELGVDLTWPPYLPELNPIENLWALMKAEIYRLHQGLTNAEDTVAIQSRFRLSDVSGTTLASLKANIVSTLQAGCFFGAILCHGATERLGGKYTLVACGIIFDVGVVLQLVSSGA
jgi:hypothetical protein